MIVDKYPKVSCVMATAGRFDLIPQSVGCYLAQTYKNKELIVLSQGDADSNANIRRYLSALRRSDILFLDAPKHLSLGAMRNLTVELTTGELICQWDDDDLYHPDRIMTQYRAIQAEAASASLYTQFLKYFRPTREMYWCDWIEDHDVSHRYLCGTVMFHKTMFYQFKNMIYPEIGDQCQLEEDLNVLEKLLMKGKVAAVTAGHQYIYVYHGQNTYDLAHHQMALDTRWKKTLMSKEFLLENKPLLEATFGLVGIKEHVIVRGKDEIAFEVPYDVGHAVS